MRDDVFGLSLFRQLVDPTRSRPAGQPSSGALNSSRPSFAAALANASRAAHAVTRPYQSPLKQTHPAPTHPATTHKPMPLQPPAGPSPASKPTPTPKPPPTRPAPPVQRPEPVKPAPTPDPSLPLSLDAYPHPNGDNGRGMHWIPTTKQDNSVVDRFVAEAQRMGVKWVTFLNDGANIGQNDYLVNKLVGAGIEPVMRVYSPTLHPLQGDIEGMVRHYVGLGVHYFQPFNEPNLNYENPDGQVSVDRYLDAWLPAAKAIMRGGGLPGFGALSPGGDKNDIEFLTEALDKLKARGELGALNRSWLSMHNYTHNHPLEERSDSDGFFKFRAYHHMLSDALGRDVPIIGTEGGTFVGEHEDTSLPAVDANTAVTMSTQAYRYMRDQREPWNFAYSFWTIANEAGGGSDQGFSNQALFQADGSRSPIVGALQALG